MKRGGIREIIYVEQPAAAVWEPQSVFEIVREWHTTTSLVG